jgi:FtsP/CotA-like multicopper oxidase with cupredoxin domain
MLRTTAFAAPAILHFGRSHAAASEYAPSPRYPAFLNTLTPGSGVPPVLAPVSTGPPPDSYSGWPTFDDETVYYDVTIRENDALVLPDPALRTTIWGYDGLYPGPTIEAELDKRIVVRFRNELSLASRTTEKCHHDEVITRPPFDFVTTSVHHHGGHTVAASDGHPMLAFGPKGYSSRQPDGFRDYIYANTSTRGGTLWYHDHCEDDTARNVFHGLAGFYILRSADEERRLAGAGIVLPKGPRVDVNGQSYGYRFDVPLVVQDRLFTPSGAFYYPPFNHEGVLGDVYCVNGKAQPRLEVEPRRYRFRLLNGSNARVYEFALAGRMPFTQIGTDGGLLPKAVRRTSVRMAPGERVDIVVDFTASAGKRIVLYNILEQTDGRGPEDEAGGVRTPIARFDVVLPLSSPDDSRVPGHLEPLLPLNADPASPYFEDYRRSDAVIVRDFRVHRRHGVWVINGSCYDPARSSTCPPVRLETTEIWRFRNSSGGWVHPMHVHLEEFKILSRNGRPPGAHEAGLKDTFLVGENETVEVITKFRDQPKAADGHNDGLYVFHCHNLEHEDMAMMGQMLSVLPDGTAPNLMPDFKASIPELTWPVRCQEPL